MRHALYLAIGARPARRSRAPLALTFALLALAAALVFTR